MPSTREKASGRPSSASPSGTLVDERIDATPEHLAAVVGAAWDVTKIEAAILRVVADPSMARKSVREKAVAAGVSRATWFRYQADPEFQEKVARCFRAVLRHDIGRVLHALVESAADPNPRSSSDRKLFFELVGMYAPPARTAPVVSPAASHTPHRMSDEELLAVFRDRGLPLPPTTRHRLIAAGKIAPDTVHG